MPSAKLLIGGTAATTVVGMRLARSLYGRWRLLPEPDRRRTETLAEDLKRKALDLRGAVDRDRADTDLRAANETLAAALVETAEADPEISAEDVHDLRQELRHELARLASADIEAWRLPRESNTPRS